MRSDRGSSHVVAIALAIVVELCVIAGRGGPAFAQAAPASRDDEQARLHFQVGSRYYDEADYESALREFQVAFRLSGRPHLLYNIALCQQQLGNLGEAISALERYLAEVQDIENRPVLEQRLANLRARRDRQAATGTDPGEDHAAPSPEPADASSTPSPASSGDSTNVPAIVGYAVAGVGLVAAVTFSVLTLFEDGNVASSPCAQTRTCTSAQTGPLGTLALVSDISWGVALAGAVVGTVFVFASPSGSSERASLRWTPLVGTTNGLTLAGSF